MKFDDRTELDDHTRQQLPCLIDTPRWTEKMSEEQVVAIRKRNPGQTDKEKWFSIYSTLFPHDIPPQSCCKEIP